MRKTVADEPQFASFDVLLDRVERLFLGDLHLCIGPTGNLYDHVENPIVLVGEERNIVEGRKNRVALFDEHSVVCGLVSILLADYVLELTKRIGSTDEARCVLYIIIWVS